jgi:hypothetical protein
VSDRLRWPVVIAASAVGLDLLALGNVHGGVRLLVTLWFLLLCTGMSFVPLLTLPSLAVQLFLGIVASLVLDTLAATVLVEVGGLSTAIGLVVLQTICLAGCALQLIPWARAPRSGS